MGEDKKACRCGTGTGFDFGPSSKSFERDVMDLENPLRHLAEGKGESNSSFLENGPVVTEMLPWLAFLSDPENSFFSILLSLTVSILASLSFSFWSFFGLDTRGFLVWNAQVFAGCVHPLNEHVFNEISLTFWLLPPPLPL